jgi:antitoxin component of MazEF toxin-antitoxin module
VKVLVAPNGRLNPSTAPVTRLAGARSAPNDFAGEAHVKSTETIDDLCFFGYNLVITLEVEMIKQLRKVGNSNALILDKPILELLGLEEDGQVQLTIQDGNLIVTPTQPKPVDPEEMSKKLDYIIKKRKDVLRRLAQ